MRIKTKAIILDFDNTLVKTADFVISHLNQVCKRLGVDYPGEVKIREILKRNLPFEEIFTSLFAEKGIELLVDYRNDAMQIPFEPVEGAVKWVKAMHEAEIKLVIVTNRVRATQERLVQAGFKEEWFLGILTPPEGVRKPDKTSYDPALKLLGEQGIGKNDVVVVGDDMDDLRACPEGVRFWAVTTGLYGVKEFEKAGLSDECIFRSVSEIELPNQHNSLEKEP